MTEESHQPPSNSLGGRATRHMYYYPDGLPILDDELLSATMKWGLLMEQPRSIGNTRTLYGERLSTIWLGLDHQYGDGEPLIFETMLFAPAPKRIECVMVNGVLTRNQHQVERTKRNFPHDKLQLRYATKSEAEDAHEKLKLQCLIPPRWRHFLLWTVGRDRTWAHEDDANEDWWTQ